jgi:hypothetical protein
MIGKEKKNLVRHGDLGSMAYQEKEHVLVDKATFEDFIELKPTTVPSNPKKGYIYYDSSDDKLKCYDGTIWNNLF